MKMKDKLNDVTKIFKELQKKGTPVKFEELKEAIEKKKEGKTINK